MKSNNGKDKNPRPNTRFVSRRVQDRVARKTAELNREEDEDRNYKDAMNRNAVPYGTTTRRTKVKDEVNASERQEEDLTDRVLAAKRASARSREQRVPTTETDTGESSPAEDNSKLLPGAHSIRPFRGSASEELSEDIVSVEDWDHSTDLESGPLMNPHAALEAELVKEVPQHRRR